MIVAGLVVGEEEDAEIRHRPAVAEAGGGGNRRAVAGSAWSCYRLRHHRSPAAAAKGREQGRSIMTARHLIPRAKLFGNPSRAMVRLSPDGKRLSWLQPRDGVLNIHVAPADDPAAAIPVTQDTKRGIRFYGWSLDSTRLLYIQDKEGDENWHIYAVDPESFAVIDLTPYEGVHAQWMGQSWNRPGLIAVGLNDRDRSWHDLYLVDLVSGERTLAFLNDGEYGSFTLDRDLGLKVLEKPQPDGGRIVYRVDGERRDEWLRIGHEDDLTTGIDGFTADGGTLYLQSSLGRDRAGLFAVDWASGAQRLLAEHPKVDVGRTLVNPVSYVAEAYGTDYLKSSWHALGEAIAGDLRRLDTAFDGEFDVASRTRDDRQWVIASSRPERPGEYHLYDRASGALSFLFDSRPELKGEALARMHPVVIPARDGLELVSYLTLPAAVDGDRPPQPLPLVLNVHGGPWAADHYGYDPEHQWLADRGYAVLSVNFRGSTGFGKSFLNAADRQWAAAMHDDLLDAVEWAVAGGIARRDKVAIMGGSYGGYATLVGLTFTPEVFACGIDIVGPSNLETLLATVPPYWAAFFENLARRVGDPRTEEGRALLQARSPLTHVARISRPLLIGQGANDPRVKQAESDQIVAAMQAKGLPVVYVLYPDEGHGFARPENRMSFFAIAEGFLSVHLGGEAEPLGSDFTGASLTVPAGAETIAGLPAALAARG
jgi:dipeptidyl aminopeptidase/acylaminoacyl peptidase